MTTEAPMVDACLAGYRVLDLTDQKGLFCAKVLADLGADVIHVEAPGGNPARTVGPFFGEKPDVERSLYWWAFSLNKRSVTADLETAAGRDLVLRLAKTADFVVESYRPGYLDSLGLGYEAFEAINPSIVYTSITPFGSTGPYSEFEATDLILQAIGSAVYITGDPDRPPVQVSAPVAYLHGGAEGAAASLIAHYHRARTGEGQHVDVSIQQCVIWTTLNTTVFWNLIKQEARRGLNIRNARGTGISPKHVWHCKDGSVIFTIIGGLTGGAGIRSLTNLLLWMQEDGIDVDAPLELVRNGLDMRQVTKEQYELLLGPVERFFSTKSVAELYERAVHDRLLLAPIATPRDLLESPQLMAREFFVDVEHPELGKSFRYPGAFAKLSETPIRAFRRAPFIGEHNGEVYGGELGLSAAPPRRAASAGSYLNPGSKESSGCRALEGVRIADFTWANAGPTAIKYLADHGATVVHVESSTHPDGLRLSNPFKDDVPGINRSGKFADLNTSKLGLALDLKKPEARAVAKRLIYWADVVADSFAPGAMEKFGLSYADIVQFKPDVIMMSTCLQGQTGPYHSYAGYGSQGAALAGFHHLTGWPDRDPCGPPGAYTDVISPRLTAAAVMAALDYRRRTGKGQRIDIAQVEMGAQFLAPQVLEYTANHEIADRRGNHARDCAPHSVYPCNGDDRWIAIAVETDRQWEALRGVMGDPPWAHGGKFSNTPARLLARAEMDERIAAWTCDQDAYDLMHRLQAAGVPAGVVQKSSDLFKDPQLAHRGHFWHLEHTEMGRCVYDGPAFSLSKTPAELRAAPCLGEHNEQVLKQLLGYTDEEIEKLVIAGALE